MARNIVIAGIQMQVIRGQDNTERMLQQLNSVAALFPWVDIICFSELCMSGLDMKLAMPIPNSSLDRLMAWAQKNDKWIIPGSFYEKANDKIYNTALVEDMAAQHNGIGTGELRSNFVFIPGKHVQTFHRDLVMCLNFEHTILQRPGQILIAAGIKQSSKGSTMDP